MVISLNYDNESLVIMNISHVFLSFETHSKHSNAGHAVFLK